MPKTIGSEIAKAVATISAQKKTITSVGTNPSSQNQTSYIPLNGSASTTNTYWTDASGVEVSFDITKDYPVGAKVSWEAFLKVENANGTAYARIFDVTHGTAVDGSEISLKDSADYQRVGSGNINLWSGRNIYRVQIKSLNSFPIYYSNGRMRVVSE